MVSSLHEVMHRFFQEDTGLFARAFTRIGLPFEEPVAGQPFPNDVSEVKPLERRIDTLVHLDLADGTEYLLAVEAQSKKDPSKHATWAYYASYLQQTFKMPSLLLVVCHDEATARWAEEPVDLGPPGWRTLTVRPLVLGPHNLPTITDPVEAAKDIPLAALSAIAHHKHGDAGRMLKAFYTAVKGTEENVDTFTEFVSTGLVGTQAGDIWEKLVAMDTSLFKSTTAQRLRAEDRAEALLDALAVRGVEVPEEVRQRVESCTDLDTLKRWFVRAITVEKAEDLFADD
ncbi:hypothetical protein [Actinacidiphila acididurans]|uniref:Uncharacterized protein n=1 Tax=Actinacidiphila acididurans TaxID=2784346 RepID=A0ABS2TMT8_9ACTN|nr:hypothetical protein [Actinacidiphila acididurans]MBM9504643.1 hypothetical protein [Actinacidiphila acididurans]